MNNEEKRQEERQKSFYDSIRTGKFSEIKDKVNPNKKEVLGWIRGYFVPDIYISNFSGFLDYLEELGIEDTEFETKVENNSFGAHNRFIRSHFLKWILANSERQTEKVKGVIKKHQKLFEQIMIFDLIDEHQYWTPVKFNELVNLLKWGIIENLPVSLFQKVTAFQYIIQNEGYLEYLDNFLLHNKVDRLKEWFLNQLTIPDNQVHPLIKKLDEIQSDPNINSYIENVISTFCERSHTGDILYEESDKSKQLGRFFELSIECKSISSSHAKILLNKLIPPSNCKTLQNRIPLGYESLENKQLTSYLEFSFDFIKRLIKRAEDIDQVMGIIEEVEKKDYQFLQKRTSSYRLHKYCYRLHDQEVSTNFLSLITFAQERILEIAKQIFQLNPLTSNEKVLAFLRRNVSPIGFTSVIYSAGKDKEKIYLDYCAKSQGFFMYNKNKDVLMNNL